MKRSEMLSKIASVIINYNEAHCVINRDKAMEIAETILQVQEEASMLPPESSRSRRTMMFDLQHTQFAHIWDENDFFEEQEPEDENN